MTANDLERLAALLGTTPASVDATLRGSVWGPALRRYTDLAAEAVPGRYTHTDVPAPAPPPDHLTWQAVDPGCGPAWSVIQVWSPARPRWRRVSPRLRVRRRRYPTPRRVR